MKNLVLASFERHPQNVFQVQAAPYGDRKERKLAATDLQGLGFLCCTMIDLRNSPQRHRWKLARKTAGFFPRPQETGGMYERTGRPRETSKQLRARSDET
ncbi:UNVERIFIED_CONTAM: hypothetical protein K2H54_023522 [Gekko kuhli]